jgi:hypothetical protein
MGKVTFAAAQVPSNPTYNWAFIDPTIGMLDVGYVSTDAPGPGPASTGLQNIATSILPRPVFEPQLGQIVRAWEPTLGFGEFIYLAVPLSTAIPLGTLVSWDFSATAPTNYSAVAVPVKGTSQKTGAPVAVCVASTSYNSGSGITSNASAAQYAWFQLGGVTQVLKTAVQVAPVSTESGAGVYVSGTIGRIYTTSSAGGQILGARLANTATVTATASCILVYLNGRPAIEGA